MASLPSSTVTDEGGRSAAVASGDAERVGCDEVGHRGKRVRAEM